MTVRFLRGPLLALLTAALAPQADAQSLLSSQGLGYVLEPADARGRALGGVLMGLQGTTLMPANPAEALTTNLMSASVSFHQDRVDALLDGTRIDSETARFPFFYATFPVGQNAALSFALVTFLDQNWRALMEDTLTLSGEQVPVRDQFVSTGGVSQLRLGGAYRVGATLITGASLNVHAGSNQRTQIREFQPGFPYAPSSSSVRWGYRGLSTTLGARWTPHEAAAIAGSVTLGGDLTGTPEDPDHASRTYQLPWEAAGGASARVAPALVLVAGGNYRGWSSSNAALEGAGGARDAWSLGGGIELDPGTVTRRTIPLRLGARTAALPFRWENEEGEEGWIDERAITGGAGLRVGAGLARIDLGVERGWRGGADVSLEESFWRFSLSAVISGR